MAHKNKRRVVVRWYDVGNDHERTLIREEITEVKAIPCFRRRIAESEEAGELASPVNLNKLAAELPPELEGQWIVDLVRRFGGNRGITQDAALRDAFNEAVAAATLAARAAVAQGKDVKGYVKRCVRSRLIDLRRYNDYRDVRLENNPFVVSTRNPHGDVKTALRILPPIAARIWHVYRRKNGTVFQIAACLGVTRYDLEARYLPYLYREVREALLCVRLIRGRRI